ncbi:MAG: hypothetical protein ACKOOC_11210, partial [Cyanobium sp.]
MIERYTLPEMGSLWSEEAKFRSWLEVEIAACQANADLGRVPAEACWEEIRVDHSKVQGGVIEKTHRPGSCVWPQQTL